MKSTQNHAHWYISTFMGAALLGVALAGPIDCGSEMTADNGDPAASPGTPAQPSGTNPGSASVTCAKASHFDGMVLARATIRGNEMGGVTVQFPIGVDEVGNLTSDGLGNIVYEQHPVSLKGTQKQVPMSPADRESLAYNIDRYLQASGPDASLWQELLGESLPKWAEVPSTARLDLARATIQSDAQGIIKVQFPIGVDQVANLHADSQGNVAYEQHAISLKGTYPLAPLSPADVDTLHSQVQQYLDTPALSTGELWRQLLAATASARAQASVFDGVDFGRAIIDTAEPGAIAVQFPIGVDQVANLHASSNGSLTYEQHPIALKGPHPLMPLGAAQRESLAANTRRYLGPAAAQSGTLWVEILHDSMKCN